MKVVILGGSGYLGFALANYLSVFFKITLCTRSLDRVKSIKKKCLIVKNNYLDIKQLEKVIRGHDVVIHSVGMSSVQISKNNSGLKLKKTITQNVVTACNNQNVKKLIYFSTIQVYKNYEKSKSINEKSKIFSKNNIYCKSHIEAEKIIINKNNKTNYVIIRLASIFGFNILQAMGEQSKTIINNICKTLVLNKKIEIQNPNTVRNFLPISIFLKNIRKIINQNQKYSIVNIGYKTYSLFDISLLISKCYERIVKEKVKYYFSKKKSKKKNLFKYKSLHLKNLYKKTVFTNEICNMINIYRKKYDRVI
jgi:nucleoside-diphosphate-sugar epimerase